MSSLLSYLRCALVCLFVCIAIQEHALAEFPEKPIRIIIPFPAGGSADVRTRQLAEIISKQIKQQVIVDNRPGAAGSIGTSLAAKSLPDGHTVLYTFTTSMAVNPHLYKDPGYRPLKDLIPLIVTLKGVAVLVVKADSQIRSVKDLVAQTKANPGKLNYGTAGPGSIQHLMGERLQRMAGVSMVAVPYKGEAPLLIDLMGGQIDVAFGFPVAVMPFVNSGRLRILAVSSAKRLAALPEIPTIAESGVPGYDEVAWSGFAVPTGTPEPIIQKLHEIFRNAMLTPEFRRDVEQSGSELVASTQDYAVRLVRSDFDRYGKIVKELGLSLE